jgi:hypothetical protein
MVKNATNLVPGDLVVAIIDNSRIKHFHEPNLVIGVEGGEENGYLLLWVLRRDRVDRWASDLSAKYDTV